MVCRIVDSISDPSVLFTKVPTGRRDAFVARLHPVGTFPKVPTGRWCACLLIHDPWVLFQKYPRVEDVAFLSHLVPVGTFSKTSPTELKSQRARSARALKRPLEVRAGSIICDPSVLFNESTDGSEMAHVCASTTRRYFCKSTDGS